MEAPDPAEIARIERDHRIDHAPEAADLAIVFGNRIAAPGMAEAAAFFFRRSLVPRILVTGGAHSGARTGQATGPLV